MSSTEHPEDVPTAADGDSVAEAPLAAPPVTDGPAAEVPPDAPSVEVPPARMSIQTCFSALEAESMDMAGKVAIVIDVIRASTVIVEALSNGARAIYPTVTTEDAIVLAQSLGREDALLCGERRGLRVDGFDLGNSPQEFSAERVRGKQLVMSTTNGTRSLRACQGSKRVFILAFTNVQAVVDRVSALAEKDRPLKVVVVCAGKEGRFALDDAICAGLLIDGLTRSADLEAPSGRAIMLDEGSRVALHLAQAFPVTERLLQTTAAGSALVEVGLGDDLASCARLNTATAVPEMEDRVIRLAAPAAAAAPNRTPPPGPGVAGGGTKG
jgi:2-phosphosulfolactate phosphatase